MTVQQPDGPDLGSVMGMGVDDVRLRLGEPVSDQAIGGERWLVYASDRWRLRLRVSQDASGLVPRVRSLTLDVDDAGPDLPPLLRRFGLTATGGAEPVPGSGGRLLRGELLVRGLPASLTANIRGGVIAAITVFDEAPDWRGTSPA